MRVRINAAWQHQTIGRVDDANTARYNEVRTRSHVLDNPIFNVDVSSKSAVMVHHLATFNVEPILRTLCLRKDTETKQ